MAKYLTEGRPDEFIAALRKLGGASGNGALRKQLDWEEDLYWKVQGSLIEKGAIIAGRGKGGSVRLSEAEVAPDQKAPIVRGACIKEKDSYGPLKAAIEQKWINRFGFDEVLVAETAFRGSKDTGGNIYKARYNCCWC